MHENGGGVKGVVARNTSFRTRPGARRDRTIGPGSSIAAAAIPWYPPHRGANRDEELERTLVRGNVHQPSIRARTPTHDVVFDRRRSGIAEGGASQTHMR